MKRTFFALLIGLLLLAACGGSSYAEAPAMDYDAGGYADEEMSFAPDAAAPGSAFNTAADTNYGESAPTAPRMVIKNAELSLVVPDPVVTLAEIGAMAEAMGGFVVTSNQYQSTLASGQKVPYASITIRVPSERLDEALTQIKAGASEVQSENVSGQDVTGDYTDLESRLRNYQAAEAQLMEIMDAATKTEDVLNVFNQLTAVREQIEVIQGQMQYYEQSAALSAIYIDLTADAAVQPIQIGGWQPGGVAKEAIETLIRSLQWLGDVLIWVGLCVLPIGLLIGLPLYFVGRKVVQARKRRKAEKTAAADPQ